MHLHLYDKRSKSNWTIPVKFLSDQVIYDYWFGDLQCVIKLKINVEAEGIR